MFLGCLDQMVKKLSDLVNPALNKISLSLGDGTSVYVQLSAVQFMYPLAIQFMQLLAIQFMYLSSLQFMYLFSVKFMYLYMQYSLCTCLEYSLCTSLEYNLCTCLQYNLCNCLQYSFCTYICSTVSVPVWSTVYVPVCSTIYVPVCITIYIPVFSTVYVPVFSTVYVPVCSTDCQFHVIIRPGHGCDFSSSILNLLDILQIPQLHPRLNIIVLLNYHCISNLLENPALSRLLKVTIAVSLHLVDFSGKINFCL